MQATHALQLRYASVQAAYALHAFQLRHASIKQ